MTADETRTIIAGSPEWVYLATAGTVVKIGYSTNPLRRLKEIYTDLASTNALTPAVLDGMDLPPLVKIGLLLRPTTGADRSALRLRAITPAGRSLEQALLRRHAEHRRHGEWLRDSALPSLDRSAPWTWVDLPYRSLVRAA